MTTVRSSLLVVLSAALFAASVAHAGISISNGKYAVEVNDYGVLLAGPASGLSTVDALPVTLRARFAEWYGLAFDSGGTHFEAVGPGNAIDWAGRLPVALVSFVAGFDSAVAITRVGDLEIETEYTFDRTGPYLIASVTFANVGTSYLTNFFYSREWHQPGELGWSFPYDYVRGPRAPTDICRRLWMLDDIAPGDKVGVGLSYQPTGWASSRAIDVPLDLWKNADWPSGLPVGNTNGISWGDYDGDGWIDMFACQSANLWRNLGGTNWVKAADLDNVLPNASYRYGSAFGDYNNDGLPDIGTEPRNSGGDSCFHLLENLGGGANFIDVATNPAIIDKPICQSDMETLCWGDVNGDGWLDLFLPVYPAHSGGPGNFFLRNLGPTGPGGAYRFTEKSKEAGLDNPSGNARPEGAQFCDVDFDGDLDLYSNGALYQNQCDLGVPRFAAMATTGSGIGYRSKLEEGAVFFDYDLDGDYDLFTVYSASNTGVQIWESYGDGMFFQAEKDIVDSPFIGLDLGESAEDWDNDGDIDFTTRQVFRRNMLMEEGKRHFIVATTNIPSTHLTSATPAWGDWDKDGDLDCALGNWLSTGHFYENVLYGTSTPASDRRYVRVRAQRDSATLEDGLETDYGASVEITLRNVSDGLRRKKFTSSSNGYLNQNEYPLHFALPADPAPADPSEDVRFDITVDFPHFPSGTLWRVDKHVNPALGNVNLATLKDREIRVFRSGRVTLNGCEIIADPVRPILRSTTTGGLALPSATVGLQGPTPSPSVNYFVGLDFDTLPASEPMRLDEVILDGQLDAAVTCGGTSFNVALWDVTVPSAPALVQANVRSTATRNRRSFFRTEVVLEPRRHYRLVARVTSLRGSPPGGRFDHDEVNVLGGLFFQDNDPCSGLGVAAAAVDPTQVPLALRFSQQLGSPWLDLANGHAGTGGTPHLEGHGIPREGNTIQLTLSGALPSSNVMVVVGRDLGCLPLYGGVLLPRLDLAFTRITNAHGQLILRGPWPGEVVQVYFQAWIADPGASQGYAASNTLAATTR